LGKWDMVKSKDANAVNYKVPNFGMDQDISDSLASEKSTSESLGKNWNPK
jgi:hypothetical protein